MSTTPPDYGATPEPPSSILAAVKLMYVGAGLSALWTILLFPQRGAYRDNLADNLDPETMDLDSAANTVIGGMAVLGVLTIAMWLWMAAANRRGNGWARIVATVLGSIAILFTLFSFTQVVGIGIILNIALIGLAGSILWLLYRPDSNAYYTAISNRLTPG
jgi:sterol desaturase/sphingolipid hydroxylase (fatty acid hydroxylase superfamily)